jgi:basic amino acid/polyamine antiporter, APA family
MNENQPHLLRRFGLLQSTALNMSNMIGVGPFITIPLLMSAMGGPQAMLGWIVAVLIIIPDGMIWSELGASLPGSGGTYNYLLEAFGRETYGRLMAFLFIWQFILSGPLEIASGYIGFARYSAYVWPGLTKIHVILIAMGLGVVNIVLLYRRITSIGKMTIVLWTGTLATTAAVIVGGALNFNPKLAFDFPPDAFHFSLGFVVGLGTASSIGIYDYLGYYDICYIGEEVRDPGRVIPRSIIISILAVAVLYFAINFSLIGVVPWREFVPANETTSQFIVSIFMERLYGSKIAIAFTLMVLWTAFGSVFALLLGYSRIPYAAALDGHFFKIFARLHPKKNFPHVSLIVIGIIAIACSGFSLEDVIAALITTRILVQFIGQICAVTLLRERAPEMSRPYKMWLYPVPSIVALFGWLFIFSTSGLKAILFGLGSLACGLIFFFAWSWQSRRWPFATNTAA